MLLVLSLAVALHLSLTAIKVSSTKEYHMHTWVHVQKIKAFITESGSEQPPFWPRYWRNLLGLKWKGLPMCPQVEGRFLDICEVAHPELLTPVGKGVYDLRPTRSQNDLLWQLSKQLSKQSR
jgi:hypothetical protein